MTAPIPPAQAPWAQLQGEAHHLPSLDNPSDRAAYGRINAVVVTGEGLADRQFRLLAQAIPEDRAELLRLAAMEGRHARDFQDCARALGIAPDRPLARRLFAPLHQRFLSCHHRGDLAGCLVIQGLVVECFAVAAYSAYLPVADEVARTITARVLADEAEHLGYAEQWLRQRFSDVEAEVRSACRQALPITLSMLSGLRADMRALGIDPQELLAVFAERFQEALETIGFDRRSAQRLLLNAVSSLPPA